MARQAAKLQTKNTRGFCFMTIGIYGIRCKQTGKWYVGAAVNVEKRIKDHFYAMRVWPNENSLARDANLFGINSIESKILETVKDRSLLCERETYWIEKLNSLSNGYNNQSSRRHRDW
jgi:group I intron endonuclease